MKSLARAGETSFDETCRFIINIGKAAHRYGSTAIRLEAFLLRLTNIFGLEGEFRSTPSDITFAFRGAKESWHRIYLTRVPGGGMNMAKLSELDVLIDTVHSGDINLSEANARIDKIDDLSDPYGKSLVAAGYLFVGVAFAAIISGGWIDILFTALLSLVVYGMVLLADRFGGWSANWLPFTTAFVAGALATLLKYFFPALDVVLLTVCAIIILIPGFSVSMGIAEIVNNHVISGLTNTINGLVYLFMQFAGAWLGVKLVSIIMTIPSAPSTIINPNWQWLFVPMLFIGVLIVFQNYKVNFVWGLVACLTTYAGVLLGSHLMGSNLGNLIGGIIAGVFANIWEHKINKPGSIVLLPSLMTLVSGSIGFRGLAASAQGQAAGMSQFWDMFLIAITITAGLLIANTLVQPKRTL